MIQFIQQNIPYFNKLTVSLYQCQMKCNAVHNEKSPYNVIFLHKTTTFKGHQFCQSKKMMIFMNKMHDAFYLTYI